MDNIMSDVSSIRRGMKLTKAEFENHQHPILREFLQNSDEKVNKVIFCWKTLYNIMSLVFIISI